MTLRNDARLSTLKKTPWEQMQDVHLTTVLSGELTSTWKYLALAGSKRMATVIVLNTVCSKPRTCAVGIVSHGGDRSVPLRQPSIDTSTLITYTKPPTLRNTVRVRWLSRRHMSNDYRHTNTFRIATTYWWKSIPVINKEHFRNQ